MSKGQGISSTVSSKALSGPLYSITLCTSNLSEAKKFYAIGLKMTFEGPLDLNDDQKQKLKSYWDIPEELSFDIYHLYQPGVQCVIHIRLIVINGETPLIHDSDNYKNPGPFAIGIPKKDLFKLRGELKELDLNAFGRIKEGQVVQADGVIKKFHEHIFKGPDHIYMMSTEIKDHPSRSLIPKEQPPIEGPGYASFITGHFDEEIEFYTHVLGMELRPDSQLFTSLHKVLGLGPNKTIRSSKIYAKGKSQNHLLILESPEDLSDNMEVAPRIPNRGMVMWTFETKDIGEILARAHAKQVKVYRTPRKNEDAIYGEAISMTLLTPSGFIVEVFSK